jgi:hypothetical protein
MYWTLESWTHNYAQVHSDDFGYCDNVQGTPGVGTHPKGKWLGPFEQFADALRASSLDTSPCENCSPSA